jgi:hypothetical protein
LRKLHNEELHKSYTLQNIIKVVTSKRMTWAGHVASTGEMRNAYKILMGNSEGKRPFRTPTQKWEDNIRM